MSKKISIALVLFFLLTLNVFASSGVVFSDLDYDDPSEEAIVNLQESSVVDGYPDGTFKSLNKINRAEFLKIVVGSVFDEAEGSNCFSDVKDEWFAKYVCFAKEQNIVDGYSDGTFKPADNINFAEASKIISKAFGLAETEDSEIWYKNFVEAIAEKNAIPFSISDLDKKIYRGEMAELVWRLKEDITDKDSLQYEELEAVPVQIGSCDELKAVYDQMVQYRYNNDVYSVEESQDGGSSDQSEDSASEVSEESSSAESVTESKSDSSDDYSETNTQVEGVDEADIVKNDGEYIYVIKGNDVRIIKAYPADEMKEISKIQIDNANFYPYEIYLDNDLLVILGNGYSDYSLEEDSDVNTTKSMLYPYGQYRTFVYIYNIEDRSNPVLNRSLQLDGSYNNSRKVDDTLYLILNKYNNYYYNDVSNIEDLIPTYKDSLDDKEKELAGCDKISYFPRQREFDYLIVSAIPLNSARDIETEVMIGSSENIYASKDNLYIASTNYDVNNYYYDYTNAKTVVYRYGLDGLDIEFKDRAKVPGTILNQFSMDEYDGYFRIATTVGNFWSATPPSNNLYILDSDDMEIVGYIEGIAPGERIYSTRFMGDRGYMVTFKNTDPLFVFDIEDPFNPKIAGELKIPGYSDYLHPYDDNHLIGFGKDAVVEDGSDFALYQGMKLSLFDITDISNPKEMFTEIIGDRGTNSELLYNHKALLFDKDKNLLSFPIEVAEKVSTADVNSSSYGEIVFQGAYVYDIDLENGFDLRGKITHYSQGDSVNCTYCYNYLKNIKRILYIGKNFYTISDGFVKANDIKTIEERRFIELEGNDYEQNYYYEE